MLGTHVAAMETFWKAAQSDSLQLKIALFNTDEMRFEWKKKTSEIPNGLEIKLARTPVVHRNGSRSSNEKGAKKES